MPEFSKKVCMLGDFAVGKTSLVRHFVEGIFDDEYLSTIGVKIDRKRVTIPYGAEPAHLTMILWDLAGSEKFSQARTNYLRGAAGAILACDLTRFATLESLYRYAIDLQQLSPRAKLLVVANKYDLVDEPQLKVSQVEVIAAKLKAPFYLTSAKTGEGVEAAFHRLGRLLVTQPESTPPKTRLGSQ